MWLNVAKKMAYCGMENKIALSGGIMQWDGACQIIKLRVTQKRPTVKKTSVFRIFHFFLNIVARLYSYY